jgi:hypothetical protein
VSEPAKAKLAVTQEADRLRVWVKVAGVPATRLFEVNVYEGLRGLEQLDIEISRKLDKLTLPDAVVRDLLDVLTLVLDSTEVAAPAPLEEASIS